MLPDYVEFTKLTAGGNDFICIDNTSGAYDELLKSPHLPAVVRRLCRRGLAVGADGLIAACETGSGHGIDVVARFLEPDGSEARLCGNGTACFTRWVLSRGLVPGPHVDILTAAGAAHGCPSKTDPERFRVCVPDPRNLEMDVEIEAAGRSWTVHLLDTGVPHGVVFVDDVDSVDVAHWGPALRHHPRFAAAGGINANFVQVNGEGDLSVRTFEFGVEAETLSCGTGSTAAAIISTLRFGWDHGFRSGRSPIRVYSRASERLDIWFVCHANGTITDVCLETHPMPVYNGVLRREFIEALLKAARNELPEPEHVPSPQPPAS